MKLTSQLSGVNIAITVAALFPLYMLVQYVSDREEAGLNALDAGVDARAAGVGAVATLDEGGSDVGEEGEKSFHLAGQSSSSKNVDDMISRT